MEWQQRDYYEQWLVKPDGEIIDRVINGGLSGGFIVRSTGKSYVSEEAAKAAAELRAKGSYANRSS